MASWDDVAKGLIGLLGDPKIELRNISNELDKLSVVEISAEKIFQEAIILKIFATDIACYFQTEDQRAKSELLDKFYLYLDGWLGTNVTQSANFLERINKYGQIARASSDGGER